MGRLDLVDKHVEWMRITRESLHELYEEIAELRTEMARQRAKNEETD